MQFESSIKHPRWARRNIVREFNIGNHAYLTKIILQINVRNINIQNDKILLSIKIYILNVF